MYCELSLKPVVRQRHVWRLLPAIWLVLSLLAPWALASAPGPDTEGLHIGSLPVGKVLVLGNSITLHGPAPQIGWTGNWGMAASSQEKDYVHLFLDRLAKAAGGRPKVMVRNIADFERRLTAFDVKEELKQELAFEADVIIIALGENAAPPQTEQAKTEFATAFSHLFAELTKRGRPKLFVRSQFWQDVVKDQLMQRACDEAGGVFVDNRQLGADESNFARAERKIEHTGVAGHPGDKGMRAIADALWTALEKQAATSK